MNRIFSRLRERVQRDDLILPTLPEMAIDIMRAFENDPLIDSAKVSAILIKDPSVSARILRIANSAFIGSPIKISTLKAAVTRIGLHKIRNIVVAVVMEQLFVSKKPSIKGMMKEEWLYKVNITACALSIYTYAKNKPDISQDELMLFCLLKNIGILPIFIEFDKEVDDDLDIKQLKQAISPLINELSIKILKAWGFDSFVDQYSNINTMSLNGFYCAGSLLTYPDYAGDLKAIYADLDVSADNKDIKQTATELKSIFI